MAKDRGWRENVRGICPPELKGTQRKVFVQLRGGEAGPVTITDPWPADTGRWNQNTNWALAGSAFDILKWKAAE